MPNEIKMADESCQSAQTLSRVPKKKITFFNRASSLRNMENTYFDQQHSDKPNQTLTLTSQTQYSTDALVKQTYPLNLTLQHTQIDPPLRITPSHPTNISQKNTTELTLLKMKPAIEKFDGFGVILVYGFEKARDLKPEAGIKKFTLNQINDALGIDYGTINHTLITALKQGIVIDEAKIDSFSKSVNLDKWIAEKLLTSYAHFLRDHYNYLSISACLQRKKQKYFESSFTYTLMKNNHNLLAKTSPEYSNNFLKLFLTFLSEGDPQGYTQKEALFCNQNKTEDQACVATALDNLLFRRLSKLGLIWSAHHHLPVNFYITFTPEDAKNKAFIESYEPITFSEYRLLSRHRTFFTHIKEIDRTSAQDQGITLALTA